MSHLKSGRHVGGHSIHIGWIGIELLNDLINLAEYILNLRGSLPQGFLVGRRLLGELPVLQDRHQDQRVGECLFHLEVLSDQLLLRQLSG